MVEEYPYPSIMYHKNSVEHSNVKETIKNEVHIHHLMLVVPCANENSVKMKKRIRSFVIEYCDDEYLHIQKLIG